ncbi:MAG TPA: hybrid sensor histidine kinase/response regulator [Polyangiaceae bacterium]|nr:hybrid sensor histidine kinase/response regulator [Polyangiaceae bacterium]
MAARPTRRKRILLVDDEVQNLELLEAYLDPLGHEMVRAQAGTEAIAFLERVPFDLVLLDIMMPGATGYEVLRRFREKRTERCVPVVLLTALVDRGSRLRGLELGANDFLPKPIDRAELVARVRTLLNLQDATDALIERTQQLLRLQALQHDLANFLVHDLKTPLSIVSGNLSLLREASLNPDLLEAVDDSRDATRRMLGMVSELLEIAKMEECGSIVRELTSESLRALADEVARERERTVRARCQSLEIGGDSATCVPMDRPLVRRALENLVDNAIRHTPAGGRIRVAAEDDPVPQLVVSNTGEAIAEQELARIFEKFGQASSSRRNNGASGLGLYFCRLVMCAHGGSIAHRTSDAWPTSFVLSFDATGTTTPEPCTRSCGGS